jgi:hypothetical protein
MRLVQNPAQDAPVRQSRLRRRRISRRWLDGVVAVHRSQPCRSASNLSVGADGLGSLKAPSSGARAITASRAACDDLTRTLLTLN